MTVDHSYSGLGFIAAMFCISAALMIWEFIERRRFKNSVRRAIKGKRQYVHQIESEIGASASTLTMLQKSRRRSWRRPEPPKLGEKSNQPKSNFKLSKLEQKSPAEVGCERYVNIETKENTMRLSSIMAIAIASLFLAAFAVPAQAKSAKVQISSEQTYDFSARRKRVVHRKVKRIRTDRVPTMASTSCLSDNNGRTICLGAADSYQYAQPERTIVMHGTLTITKRIHKRTEAKRGGLIADIKSRLVTVATAAGIKITVHPAFAAQFQAFIADLVSQGHKPRFITCYARGHVSGSNHHWGGACDVDQTGWNRTSAFMYHAGNTIRANGLYDGCSFRDCGHVEAMRGTHNNPPNVYASVEKFKQQNIGAMP